MPNTIRWEMYSAERAAWLRAILDAPLAKRPARVRRAVPDATKAAVRLRDGSTCTYCGREGAQHTGPDGKTWSFDHVRPVVCGGGNDEPNIALCCQRCNQRKGDRYSDNPHRRAVLFGIMRLSDEAFHALQLLRMWHAYLSEYGHISAELVAKIPGTGWRFPKECVYGPHRAYMHEFVYGRGNAKVRRVKACIPYDEALRLLSEYVGGPIDHLSPILDAEMEEAEAIR